MVVYEDISKLEKINNSILTIGTFDGIHKGHLSIFKMMNKFSSDKNLKVVVSFSPHPKIILDKKQKVRILTNKEKKIDLIKKAGIDVLVLLPFNDSFSKMSSKDFLNKIIINLFSPSIILVGYDHKFGFDRKGDYDFLKTYEKNNNYIAKKVEAYEIDKEIISSSLIRKKIENSKITIANNYLGWNYEISGIVVKGKGRGRKINFPTANIEIVKDNLCIPSTGVYAITVKIDGNKYKGMCNIGYRPTFDDLIKPIIEVNIFHIFKDVFYGKIITVIFDKYIRNEKKFDSIEELVNQLELDKKKCIM